MSKESLNIIDLRWSNTGKTGAHAVAGALESKTSPIIKSKNKTTYNKIQSCS